MICPYTVGHQVSSFVGGRAADGREGAESQRTIEVIIFVQAQCPKEGCAVWRDGKCGYRE